MRIISWNIQWGRGADGRVELDRTVAALRAMPQADVICLQELAQNLPGLKGGKQEDAVAHLAAAFPDYHAVFGPAVDVADGAGGRSRFGNLVLSRLPVEQVFRHLLPCPVDPGVPSMQRGCVEVVVQARWGKLRVLTTHLEYYSGRQRITQVSFLRALQEEVVSHSRAQAPTGERNPAFSAHIRPASAVICGDFNSEPDSPEHALMAADISPDVPGWRDAWRIARPREPHAPTVGLHGAEWPDRPYCCDFVWVTDDLVSRVAHVAVNAESDASDHQPVLLELRD